jgi:hypothetical protein
MKNISFKKILPHLVAVVTFLLLSIFLNKPALEGKAVEQNDVIQWKAMAQQSFEFKEKYGYPPGTCAENFDIRISQTSVLSVYSRTMLLPPLYRNRS